MMRARLLGPLAAAAALSACAHFSPGRAIEQETPPSPAAPWTPTPEALEQQKPTPPPEIPEKYRDAKTLLTLPEVIDIALRNNPATRASWARARSAAAVLGQKRAEFCNLVGFNGAAIRETRRG